MSSNRLVSDRQLLDEIAASLDNLTQSVERVSALLAHPSAIHVSEKPKPSKAKLAILIKPEDDLFFEGGLETVEAERLIRIIANASAAAERVATYFRELSIPVHETHQVSVSAAARYSVTLRDSLSSMSRVMGFHNYVQKTPEWTNLSEGEDETDGQ